MIQAEHILQARKDISGYKINTHTKESHELFFVKGQLETMRCTDSTDEIITIYVAHGQYLGHAEFHIYPSTTEDQLDALITQAISRAKLIDNAPYTLPAGETGSYRVESSAKDYSPGELAAKIAKTVLDAGVITDGGLNALEVFINKHTDRICSSTGMRKVQVRYDAMVEAIPTCNGADQSVELYCQLNFSDPDFSMLTREISQQMKAVQARLQAQAPAQPLDCPVVLNKLELETLFCAVCEQLDYATIYSRSGLFSMGDPIQSLTDGDPIGITMSGSLPENVHSRCFDSDGISLGQKRILDGGTVVGYYGDNQHGQYLGQTPIGMLSCLSADCGTLSEAELAETEHLEIISMSGLQVDFFSDYIGGEIRLAYHHNKGVVTPVTGISVSGKLSQVLNRIRFSNICQNGAQYTGPMQAMLRDMNIY